MVNNKNKQRHASLGFTIIEVMIVLAIAALILLIVLLAVPALQRNARNTTLKNDVSTLAGAITTSATDSSGRMPTNVAGTGTVTITNTVNSQAKINGSTVVKFRSAASASPPTVGSSSSQVNAGRIIAWAGHTCPVAEGGTGKVNHKSFALFYVIETSGGISSLQCVDT